MSDKQDVVIGAIGGPPPEEKSTSKLLELQENLDEENNSLPWFSATKPTYVVEVMRGSQLRIFVAQKVDHKPATLKLTGFEITNPLEQINNLKDAEKHADREVIYDIDFPWHRVISIRNITYRRG